MPTFTNNRSGESCTLDLAPADIAARFAATATPDNWLWFWLARHVERHGQLNQTSPQTTAVRDMTIFLGDMFLYAIGRGLKAPKIRAQYRDRRYKLSLSRRGTLCLYSGAVIPGTSKPQGNEEYVGCFLDGRFLPPGRPTPRTVRPDEQEFLDNLTSDPVHFLAKCSRDMDSCCYCNQALSDPRSKLVGYGKVCASRWGLPWGEKEFKENMPSFADLWSNAHRYGGSQETIRGLLAGIRDDPMTALRWLILNDALQEGGWPEDRLTTPPTKSFVVPRS